MEYERDLDGMVDVMGILAEELELQFRIIIAAKNHQSRTD